MKVKKFITKKAFSILFFVFLMILTLCACGKSNTNSNSKVEVDAEIVESAPASSEKKEKSGNSGEISVIEDVEMIEPNKEASNIEQNEINENSQHNSKNFDPSSIKTYGDIINLVDSKDISTYGVGDGKNYKMQIAFYINGDCYYAKMTLQGEIYEKYNDLDIFDDDHEQKKNELLSPVEFDEFINATEKMPSIPQKTLDKKYVGKNGQALFDDGFQCEGKTNDIVSFSKDNWEYYVTFDIENLWDATEDMSRSEEENFFSNLKILEIYQSGSFAFDKNINI